MAPPTGMATAMATITYRPIWILTKSIMACTATIPSTAGTSSIFIRWTVANIRHRSIWRTSKMPRTIFWCRSRTWRIAWYCRRRRSTAVTVTCWWSTRSWCTTTIQIQIAMAAIIWVMAVKRDVFANCDIRHSNRRRNDRAPVCDPNPWKMYERK